MIKFVRSRIQVKLVLVFVGVLLVSAILVSQSIAGFSIGLLTSEEQANESGLLRSQVQTALNQLTAVENDIVGLSLAADTRLLVEAMVSKPGRNILATFQDNTIQFLSQHPSYSSVAMLDASGQELARVDTSGSEQKVATGADLADRSASPDFIAVGDLDAGQVYVTSFDPARENSTLTYSTPIYASTGDFVGALVLTASSKLVTEPFLLENSDTNVYLVDLAGKYLASNASSALQNTSFQQDQPQDAKHVLSDAEGSIIQSTDRPEFLQTYQQLLIPSSNGVKIVAIREKPIALLLSRTNGVRETTLLVFGIAVIVLAVIMWVLTGPIVQPLRQLEASTTEISQGNFDVVLPVVRSSDEVGTLAAAFGTMSRELRLSYTELDQRVRARTSELAAVAKVSSAATRLIEVEPLLKEVIAQTQGSFGFDRVEVLLVDDKDDQWLVSQTEKVSVSDPSTLVARVARERKILKSNTDGKGIEIALPLVVSGRFLGVFDIRSAAISPSQEEVLVTLADQITVAILNAKQYEAKVAEVQGLIEVDKLKSSFLANMSHELRTPLNAVINFTDFVLQGWYGDVNEEQSEQLRKVISHSDHLLVLINDLLDLTKIKSGMMELFREDIDLDELVSEVVSAGRALLKDGKTTLEVDLQSNLPRAFVDRRRIKQILLNLVSNAVKFTPQGTITIAAHCVNNVATFLVKDTGTGIAPLDQEVIFERFKQTQEGLRKSGSSGLGLPISRGLAAAHGGRLWVESAVGKGSTFYVAIPIEVVTPIAELR